MEDIENESLLKLFAHACQLEQDSRALDICKLMSAQGLQLAITYASRIKRLQLASKISGNSQSSIKNIYFAIFSVKYVKICQKK